MKSDQTSNYYAAMGSLRLDDLRLVAALSELKNLPAAARILGMEHSTAFRRLRQIEKSVGAKLFEKHRTGYTLTEAGQHLAGLSTKIDEEVLPISRRLEARDADVAGKLFITTNDSLLNELLIPILTRFEDQFPFVQVNILVSNSAVNLSKRHADVAIRASDSPPDALFGRRLGRLAWGLYGRASDFALDEHTCSIETLFDRKWVALGRDLAQLKISKFVDSHVTENNIRCRINSTLGLANAVEAGMGIGFLPCFIAEKKRGLVRLSRLKDDESTDLWILTHPDLKDSVRVRTFMEFVGHQFDSARILSVP